MGAIRVGAYVDPLPSPLPYPLVTQTMTNLKIKSTFGNFKFAGETEVTDEQLVILGGRGLLQEVQRSPATAAEKELAGYDKRPAGFKRTSIDYSEANAAVLAKHLGAFVLEADDTVDAEGKVVPGVKHQITLVLEVEEHVPNSGGEPKYKSVKDDIKLYLTSGVVPGKTSTGEDRTVLTFAANRGIVPPEDASVWEDDTTFLAAVREWDKAEKAKRD